MALPSISIRQMIQRVDPRRTIVFFTYPEGATVQADAAGRLVGRTVHQWLKHGGVASREKARWWE